MVNFVYVESEEELNGNDFELWGKKITHIEEVFVYKKMVNEDTED